MENKPVWMNDPSVKDISEEKLEFLSELVLGSQGQTQMETLRYMMTKIKLAQKMGLTYSQDEINAVIAAIQKHSTPEEIARMEEITKKVWSRPTISL